jgi:hypothetical protein
MCVCMYVCMYVCEAVHARVALCFCVLCVTEDVSIDRSTSASMYVGVLEWVAIVERASVSGMSTEENYAAVSEPWKLIPASISLFNCIE